MTRMDSWLQRVAVIAALVERASSGSFGRTALMKCLYFLQTLRSVPLGYDFSLYTYGPFDSDVLSDLSLAERRGYVASELMSFRGGQRYELRAAEGTTTLPKRVAQFLVEHQDDIDWVMQEFGHRSALDLEMISTLIYVDRGVADENDHMKLVELAKKVKEIKPHLSLDAIKHEAEDLKEKELLEATD